ncbi:DUF6477 family protein [Albirhodobacter sp. R86504]|uniref:DUF6477 family protein n=1 Tax=Albirhodobacter sp. R86504 TaxID=3093848 RepID=UPI00366CDE7E
MTDIHSLLAELKRPRLLVRAARLGIAQYNRKRDLRRLLRGTDAPGPEAALARLIDEEAQLEEVRQSGETTYSLNRHIEILIAILAEARLLPARKGPSTGAV